MSEPKSWCMICALRNLEGGLRTPVYFAKGLWLTLIPDWLRLEPVMEQLASPDRDLLKQLQYAFVMEYEATTWGAPDPDWNGPEPRSVQDTKKEVAQLANLAMWIVKPSPACYELVFHAPRWKDGWNVQSSEKSVRIRCHPKDRYAVLSNHDLEEAARLHSALCSVPVGNAVRTAVQCTWAALQVEDIEVRNLLFWTALEAIFGPEAGPDGDRRMAERIGVFLSNDAAEARKARERIGPAISFRHGLARGRPPGREELSGFGHETEILVRRALDKLLTDDGLLERFCDPCGRESSLEELLIEN